MKIKSGLKIIILSLTMILILVGGYMTYRKLSYDKKVFETDLRSFVPASSKFVLQINKEKDIKRLMPYLTNMPEPYSLLMDTHFFNYPLFFLNNDSELLMLCKQTISQQTNIKDILRSKIFPGFPPKEKQYKDATIQFYTTADHNFFCCMFYNGIFAASYNYKLLETVVDAQKEPSFFKPFTEIKNYEKIKPNYCANLYLKDSSDISVFNINIEPTSLILEGYTYKPENEIDEEISFQDIDFTIFPDNGILDYKLTLNKNLIDSSIAPLFHELGYLFYLNANNSPLSVLKHRGSKFQVYDILNELEVKNIGRKFNTKDFAFNNQRIYTASKKLSEDIFKSNVTIYLTFYKDYLIYSSDKQILIYYLSNNGSYTPIQEEKSILDTNIISFSKKSSGSNFNKDKWNFLFPDSTINIYIRETVGDGTSNKIEIILNN